MKKLLGIVVLSFFLSTKLFAKTCNDDLTYDLDWNKPSYSMLYLKVYNSNKYAIGITEISLTTKNGDVVNSFIPREVAQKLNDKSIFTIGPFGKNFTSYGASKINHKIVHSVIFKCFDNR